MQCNDDQADEKGKKVVENSSKSCPAFDDLAGKAKVDLHFYVPCITTTGTNKGCYLVIFKSKREY